MGVSFTQRELFSLITSTFEWYKGDEKSGIPAFCDKNAAKVMIHRHKKEVLSQESYDRLFFHFGYKRELIWTKN